MPNAGKSKTKTTKVPSSTSTYLCDGEKQIVLTPGIPIVSYVIGSRSDLKPGAHFTIISATKKPDGTLETARVNVGRDGVVPQ